MADFKTAFNFVMQNEDSTLSGIVTTDEGGRTRFGVAEKYHGNLADDFFTCDKEKALAEAEVIYQEQYWGAIDGDEIADQECANKLLDMCINLGDANAIHMLQTSLNFLSRGSVTEDNRFGPRTLAALNAAPPLRLTSVLRQSCVHHYEQIAQRRPVTEAEYSSWMRRAAK